ncbi:MAG TPA: type II secretion system F family protein [Dehalococcoidia bacterium]|nr:type II secretion system F family protein [Dehalococcoidia bacterium]
MILLTAICAAVTMTLLVFAALSRREDVFRARLQALATQTPSGEQADFSMPFLERVLYPLTDNLAGRVISLLPPGWAQRMNKALIEAGEPVTFRQFVGIWILVFGSIGLGGLFLVVSTGYLANPLGLPLLAVLLLVAAVLPYSFLNTAGKRRQKLIFKALPDAMDLITTSVEAGLGLDAALSKVAEKGNGPLGIELGRALRQIALGKSRREALEEMSQRTQVPELQAFVGAVIQAEQLGVSLAQVLRVQADRLRVIRRQKAQEQAMQAPVKMVFPLVLLVLPTLLMVILGPAAIKFMEGGLTGGA